MSYGRFLKPAYYPSFLPYRVGRRNVITGVISSVAGTLNSGSSIYDLIDGKPLVRTSWDTSGATTTKLVIAFDMGTDSHPFDFIAVLNHNVATAAGVIKLRSHTSAFTAATDGADVPITWLVGGVTGSPGDPPEFQTADGSSVGTFTAVTDRRYWAIIFQPHTTNFSATDLEVGQLMLGKRHVAAVGPDYSSIRRGVSFDGVKVIEAQGGGGYGSAAWTVADVSGGTTFGQPFHTAGTITAKRAGGRRALKFRQTFMQDTTLLSDNLASGTADDSFEQRVMQITAGSLHPLVFCPDSTSTTLGDYMFARLESDWELQQQAANVYSYEIQVTEEL